MLAGIGVLILVSQFHVMLDHKAMWNGEKAHGGLQYIATLPAAVTKCFSRKSEGNHQWAAITGIVTIGCILAWQSLAPKKVRLLPAPLVGIVVATRLALAFGLDIEMLNVPRNMLDEVTWPSTTWLQMLFEPAVLTGALVIGLVASAETSLCATAVDQMHQGERTDYDRELMAQGIGNSLCGCLVRFQ